MRLFRFIMLALALLMAPATLHREAWFGSIAHAVEVDLMWPKGTQFFDDNGDTLAAGTINIYDAGTTSLRTTYSDAAGTVANSLNGSNAVVLDSAGRLAESIYIPTGSWKYVLKDSGGTTVATEDTIEGAHATSTFLTGSSTWELPVLSKTANYTVTSSDRGKCINGDPTGGAFTITLESAATAGDGKTVCIRHVGTANEITIATVSSQTIDGHDTLPLARQYESVLLVSDGANWHVAAQNTPAGHLMFQVVDRLSAPPASPTAGAWYIIDGTPTGNWSTFSDGDIVRAAGDGGWHGFTPPTDSGWLAFVQDENVVYQYQDSAWVAWSNITAPAASQLDSIVLNYEEADGTTGDTPTAAAWTKYPLSTAVTNTITGATMASSVVTLDTGNYILYGTATFNDTNESRLRWKRTDASGTEIYGPIFDATAANGIRGNAQIYGAFNVGSDDQTFELQYYVLTGSANGLGVASGDTGTTEVYGQLQVIKVDIEQGPQGDAGSQGAQGESGVSGLSFNFDSSVTMADPGAGDLRFSDSTIASVTAIAIDDTSSDTGNPDFSTYIIAWDDSTSTVKGQVRIVKESAQENFAVFDLDSLTDNSGWSQLGVTHVTSSGSFSNTDALKIEFIPAGDKGDTGATGSTGATGATGAAGTDPGFYYLFDSSTTMAEPGDGDIRLNNGTLSAVTAAAFDDNSAESGNPDASAWVLSFDDVTNTGARGILYIQQRETPENFAVYEVSGAVTDNTSWVQVPLTHVSSSGTLTAATALSIQFIPAGSDGAGTIGGSTGATDNAVLRADGVGGATIQNSGVIVDDSDNVTGMASLTMSGDIDMGTTGNRIDLDTDNDTSIRTSGDDAITFETAGVDRVVLGGATLRPDTDDGFPLGMSGTAWSDLFLASGGVINFNSGDVTFTHSANTITVGGASTGLNLSAGTVQEGGVDISPIGQQTIYVPANAMTARTTNGCATSSAETTTNKVMLEACDFDAATDEFAQFSIQMPKSWNESTVVAQFVWKSTETSGDVVWGLQGGCFANDQDPDTAFGTAVTVTDTAGGAAEDIMISAESSAMTLAGSPSAEEWCVFQVYRDANAGGDTKSNDADLLGVKIHYTTDAATDD